MPVMRNLDPVKRERASPLPGFVSLVDVFIIFIGQVG